MKWYKLLAPSTGVQGTNKISRIKIESDADWCNSHDPRFTACCSRASRFQPGPNIQQIMTNYWHNHWFSHSLSLASHLMVTNQWCQSASQSNSLTDSLIVRTLALTVVAVFLSRTSFTSCCWDWLNVLLPPPPLKTDEDGFSSEFELTLIVSNIIL